MNFGLMLTAGGGAGMMVTVIYMAVIIGFFYFILIPLIRKIVACRILSCGLKDIFVVSTCLYAVENMIISYYIYEICALIFNL